MNLELIEKWLEHCKQAGHTTQSEAMEQGKKPNRKKYATFEMSASGRRIYCGLEYCDWTAEGR